MSWSRRSRTPPWRRRAAGTSSVPRPGSGPHPAASPRPAPGVRRRTAPSAAARAPPHARLGERPGRRRPRPARLRLGRAPAPVDRRRRGAQRPARRPCPDDRGQFLNGLLDHRLVLSSALPGLEQLAQQRMRRFPATSITLRAFASSASARSARRRSTRVLGLQRMRRLPPPRPLERLERAGVALLAPLAQDRRVQPLAAQQRPDLARLRTRVSLTQHPQLVLRREPTPLRALRPAPGPAPPPARRAAAAPLRSPTARSTPRPPAPPCCINYITCSDLALIIAWS